MKKAQSHISMVFDLVSYKSQLLESQIYMRMPDTCHPRMCKICPINNHHALAPLTFELANLFVWLGGQGRVGPLICSTSPSLYNSK